MNQSGCLALRGVFRATEKCLASKTETIEFRMRAFGLNITANQHLPPQTASKYVLETENVLCGDYQK